MSDRHHSDGERYDTNAECAQIVEDIKVANMNATCPPTIYLYIPVVTGTWPSVTASYAQDSASCI